MTTSARAVFLSYASEDTAIARRLAEALRAAGIEVWFDQAELRGGDAWDRQIRTQIHDCALFVAVISQHTETRTEGYFRREWRLAVDRTLDMADDARFLLPVVVDATDEARARVPDRFREVHWTRLREGEPPTVLVTRIEGLLQMPAAASPATTSAEPARERNAAAASPRLKLALRIVLAAVALAALASVVYFGVRGFGGAKPPAVAPDASAPAVPIAGNSIAVLPFLDMSEKKDQEYFSDGLAEELLDLLAKVPGLHVTARTSSFYYKGRQATVAEIAKTLGVGHLLEGSVRKSGNRLRVTTQLIRTDNGEHVWSETYDRELKDVFAVQDEIAAAVVVALRVRLAPDEIGGSVVGGLTPGIVAGGPPARAVGTRIPEAHDQLLLGRELMMRGSVDSAKRAVAAFREAIRLDPRFAEAYANLAATLTDEASSTDSAPGYAAAAAAANRALELAPALADAYTARGRLRLFTLDFAGARADAAAAKRLAPGDARALTFYGDVQAAIGDIGGGIATFKSAKALDPLNRAAWSHLGNLLLATPDRAEARRALERAFAISPESEDAIYGLATLDLLEGHPERTIAAADRPSRTQTSRLMQRALAEYTLGRGADSERDLKELVACCAAFGAYQVAAVHAWRGEKAQAYEWLERAYRQRDSGFSGLNTDPWFATLRGEARYADLLRTLKLPP